MKKLLLNWNLFRIIRLILGIFVIVQGIATREVWFAIAGGVVAFMAVVNVGCCGAGGCAVNTQTNQRKTKEEIIYEEVDSTK